MKIKKSLLYVVIIIGLLFGYGVYKRYSSEHSVLLEADLTKAGDVQEFEFTTYFGKYTIGLSMQDSGFDGSNFDGNYTIEYYVNGKFDRKELINPETIAKYYQGLYHTSSAWSGGMLFKPVYWGSITLGQVVKHGKHTIKITVIRPESQIKNINKQLYFFADNYHEKTMQELSQTYEQEKDADQKRKLLENLIDANETNQTLIPLRKALDSNDMESVKKILKSDNNITVNTDMIFQRRALHYAAFHNNTALTKYLIAHGADIHHKDELGKNALAYAIENNATKTAKLLIESGVDVNEVVFVQNYLQFRTNKDSKTFICSPLQYAAGNALFEMTELLLQHKIIDKQVWLGGGKIMTQKDEYQLFNNIYDNNIHGDGLTDIERKKIVKLFEKYNFVVPRPTQSQQIGY